MAAASRARLLLLCAWALAAAGCATLSGNVAEPATDVRVSAIPPEQRRLEPLLEQAVLIAIGHRVTVRCWTATEWIDVADDAARQSGLPGPASVIGIAEDGPTPTINLAPRVCEPLAWLAQGGNVAVGEPAYEMAQALVTVGHEAGHLASDLDTEASAECYGAQHVSAMAQALGRTKAEGDLLAGLYWNWVYPQLDPMYTSPECRDGGAFDLNPWSSRWP
jgi:hypothetical protein